VIRPQNPDVVQNIPLFAKRGFPISDAQLIAGSDLAEESSSRKALAANENIFLAPLGGRRDEPRQEPGIDVCASPYPAGRLRNFSHAYTRVQRRQPEADELFRLRIDALELRGANFAKLRCGSSAAGGEVSPRPTTIEDPPPASVKSTI
jgi:hypothetical protein